MKVLKTIFILLIFNNIAAQKCNCKAIVDINFKNKIVVFDKPNGKQIKTLKQDFKNENLLVLNIENDSLNFFKVDIEDSLSENSNTKGWIKKSKVIGTYARNYGNRERLNLYSDHNKNSEVLSIVEEWTNQLYTIEKCFEKWVYVKIKFKGKIKQGWLEYDFQCPNPYTTCN